MILKAPLKESINIAEEKHQRKDLLRGPRKQIHFSNGDINLKETLVTLSTMCVCAYAKKNVYAIVTVEMNSRKNTMCDKWKILLS